MESLASSRHETFKDRFLKSYSFSTTTWGVYWFAFISFPIAKGVLRPKVLAHIPDSFLAVVLLSYPNFVEAIIGSVTVTTILFLLRFRFSNRMKAMSNQTLYICSILLSSLFVITQELKIHNLGGENFYDPNDVIASLIGLLLMFFVLMKYGIYLPKKKNPD